MGEIIKEKTKRILKKMTEKIDRIIIAEGKVKANLKRNICSKCGRAYFIKILEDGIIIEPILCVWGCLMGG